MSSLPDGVAARLCALEEEDDEVDHRVPTSWGVNNCSSNFRSEHEKMSSSGALATSYSTSTYSFAPAFAPVKRKADPYEPDQDCTRSFRGEHHTSALDYYEPEAMDDGESELDPRLENPNIDVDPNIRAKFVPISQLHRTQAQRSSFALRNPNLVASNATGAITTVLGGEKITYTPKAGDNRLSELDRHGNYLGSYKGEIKKSRIRRYLDNVRERDRQMLQETAEYRILANMSIEERTNLLERLRKPYEWKGAFSADQRDEDHIPEVYNRQRPTTTLMAGRDDDVSLLPSDAGSALWPRPDSTDSNSISGGFNDGDDFAAGSSFVPLAKPRDRTQQYFSDVLDYGKEQSSGKSTPGSRFSQGCLRTVGTGASVTPSNGCLDDLLSFDDSPELQIPEDCPVSDVKMTPEQEQFYHDADNLSDGYGRVVLVHLHQSVKFSPGAVANRIFGGIIQEMQLFPAQKVAIVIFLHPSEAKAFLRHVKNVRVSGNDEEIRALQIEAGWYKGSEKPDSLLPIQPNILAHHIAFNATRCLRLHHLPTSKTKETVSSDLGARLAMPLLTVILCPARLDTFRSRAVYDPRLEQDAPLGSEARLGRQAIVEFASISDAIRARKMLMEHQIDEYEDCVPVFAADPSAEPTTERKYCKCAGCKYLRAQKGSRLE